MAVNVSKTCGIVYMSSSIIPPSQKEENGLKLFSFFCIFLKGDMKIYYLCKQDEYTDDIRYSLNYRKKPTRRQKILFFKRVGDSLYEVASWKEKKD